MSNSIELYSKLNDPMAAVEKVGEWFAKSGMFRARNTEQGQMLAFICMVEQKSPTELLRENHIMDDGTLVPKSRNVHARFLERGGEVEWIALGDEQADFEKRFAEAIIKFKGKSHRIRFSVSQAREQKLPVDKENGVWRKNTAKMLRARVLTTGIDLFCPDIVLGIPDEELGADQTAPKLNISAEPPKPTKVEASPAPTPTPAPTKETTKAEAKPTVIDAEVLPPKPAPAPTPVPAPQPTTTAATGELPADLLAQVEAVIGDKGLDALRWLREQGKIKPDQGLAHIRPALAQNIIAKPDAFLRAITRPKA